MAERRCSVKWGFLSQHQQPVNPGEPQTAPSMGSAQIKLKPFLSLPDLCFFFFFGFSKGQLCCSTHVLENIYSPLTVVSPLWSKKTKTLQPTFAHAAHWERSPPSRLLGGTVRSALWCSSLGRRVGHVGSHSSYMHWSELLSTPNLTERCHMLNNFIFQDRRSWVHNKLHASKSETDWIHSLLVPAYRIPQALMSLLLRCGIWRMLAKHTLKLPASGC